MTRPDPPYVMTRTDAETQRLELQAELYAPLTRRLVIEAGVAQGARVLDVGCGAGHVTALLAELVGPSGWVVGIDLSSDALRAARDHIAGSGLNNITFIEGDIRHVALGAHFDAVVGRFILHWVADAGDVVRAGAAHLKPGGVLVFQEHDLLDTPHYRAFPSAPASPFAEQLQSTLQRHHIDVTTSYRLYGSFQDAGLRDPHLLYEAPIAGGPGWLGYAVMDGHVQRFGPLMHEAGLTTHAELDPGTFRERLESGLTQSRGVLRCIPTVGIWARRPAVQD